MSLLTFDVFKKLPPPEGGIEIVGEKLTRLQTVLTGMLEDVHRICAENGLDYQLGGGSCLGAVRHGGFIPWDDDVDLNMPRASFERFAEIIRADYADTYWLHEPSRTPGYGLGFPRLRLKDTVLRTRDDFDTDECGVYLDIFLIESAPNNALLRRLHGLGSLAIGFALSCRKFYTHRSAYYAMAAGHDDVLRTFRTKARIGFVTAFLSIDRWTRLWDRWNSLVRGSTSRDVTIPVGRKHYFGELYPRDVLFPSRPLPFGSGTFSGPNDPHAYLSGLYGEYMSIPAPEDRESHIVFELELGQRGEGR